MNDAQEVKIRSDPHIFGGRPIIGLHRITVHRVAIRIQAGYTPEEIAEGYCLTSAELQAALDYYDEHREQIDRELIEDEEEIQRHVAADTSPATEQFRRALRERQARRSYG